MPEAIIPSSLIAVVEKNGPTALPIPEELYTEIEDADILFVHICPIPGELIKRAKKLRAILVNRGGLENIDVATATECGIPVFNNPAHNSNAVAEMTVALMIAESRNIVRSHYAVKHGDWRENYSNFGNIWEMKGRTVGIIGFSSIGRLVAEKLSSFGVKIMATDIKYDPEDEFIKKYNIKMVDLPTLMRESDYVTLHARVNKCILDREMLNLMKPTAIFINTARAHMVDYDALYELLKNKKILGAALDVFPSEPLSIDNPFLTLDNVTLDEFLEWVKDTDLVINWELKEYPVELGDRAYETADLLIDKIEQCGLSERSLMNSFSQQLLEYIYDKYEGKYIIHAYVGYEKLDVSKKPIESFADWSAIWRKDEDHLCGFEDDYSYLSKNKVLPCILVPDSVENYKKAIDLGCTMFTTNDVETATTCLKQLGKR